jgi:hypothetical protein
MGINTSIGQGKIDAQDAKLNLQLNINSIGDLINFGSGGCQFVNSTSSYSPATLNYYED